MADQYVVSARKYRPQRFSEVVGQGHITETLKNALKSDHLAHAFLFCGPRGVGKTTCARILAKVLNCEQPTEDMEPCGVCPMCVRMSKQASFNIIEQDGASNNKVDDIRDLIGHVNSPPPHGNYKVFIIDEVHMLTSQAFNAFLKTLEEPPPHAVFILATTEKHKILPTILSRCQIYDFRRVEVDAIASHLRYISEQEGIQAEEEALHLIAQKADGALRDSLSLFDRIASASDGPLTYQSVIDNLNILDYEYYFETTDALLEKNLPAVLQGFQEVLRKGFEPQQILQGLSEHFRDLLLCQQPASVSLLEVGSKIKERYMEQARLVDMPFLLSALEICNQCDVHYVRALNKRLHVELALAKLAHIQDAREVDPFVQEKKKLRPEDVTQVPDSSQTQVASRKEPPASQSGEPEEAEKMPPSEVNEPPAREITEERAPAAAPPPSAKKTEPKATETEKVEVSPAEKKKEGPPASDTPKAPEPSRSLSPDKGTTQDRPFTSSPEASSALARRRKARRTAHGVSSLADLEASVESQQTLNNDDRPAFTESAVQSFFEKLTLAANPGALKLVLGHVQAKIKNGELFLFVESAVEKTTLLQEVDLIQKLRNEFGQVKLKVHIDIDPERKVDTGAPERPKTKKEVLDDFAQQNTTFQQMMERWKLTFDK